MQKIVEGQLLDEKAELDQVSPVISTSDADDYPDGGLAAWCVVVGVSPLSVSSSFGIY